MAGRDVANAGWLEEIAAAVPPGRMLQVGVSVTYGPAWFRYFMRLRAKAPGA